MTSRVLVLLERNVVRGESAPDILRKPDDVILDSAVHMSKPPPGYEDGKRNHWKVAAYWQEQLLESDRWYDNWPKGTDGIRRGLRPASLILKEHKYLDVLRAIRWWCGPNGLKPGRSFTIYWLRKNMETFYRRMYQSKH